jgi:hypothetical protein
MPCLLLDNETGWRMGLKAVFLQARITLSWMHIHIYCPETLPQSEGCNGYIHLTFRDAYHQHLHHVNGFMYVPCGGYTVSDTSPAIPTTVSHTEAMHETQADFRSPEGYSIGKYLTV